MTPERFNDLLENRLSLTRDVLGSKAGEYASTSDRLHNFKAAAAMLRGTPEQALLGMLVKHMVSIYDMVLDGQPRAIALWDEKIGDAINYMILLEALVKEGEPATATVVSSYERQRLDVVGDRTGSVYRHVVRGRFGSDDGIALTCGAADVTLSVDVPLESPPTS